MKDGFIKIAAASPAIRVADCEYNAAGITQCMRRAYKSGVRLIVFPELSLCGYTCGDLLLHDTLLDGCEAALSDILAATEDLRMAACIGLPVRNNGTLYNCAAVICGGRLLGLVPKTNLPNYGEFYELRHFSPAPLANCRCTLCSSDVPFGTKLLFSCSGFPEFTFAVEICEDLWVAEPPGVHHATAGAVIIANLSASDETIGKADYRRELVCSQSARLICAYVYADASRGESSTDMVFAAHDLIAENGALLNEALPFGDGYVTADADVDMLLYERRRMNTFPSRYTEGYETVAFEADIIQTPLERVFPRHPFIPQDDATRAQRCELILSIQARGLAGRLEHISAKAAVVGISGGLDSCLALLAAHRAMQLLNRPASDVLAVTMPCFGTTPRTRRNAELLSKELGVGFREVDITDTVLTHLASIAHPVDLHDVVYENAQARARTYALMDIANAEGGIVVGTGDLSELALGWATYNGDHMSMYGVNASVPKTLVKHIIRYCADTACSPGLKAVLEDILATPVSPELLPAENGNIVQKTEDIVGPYELHDFILYYAIRKGFAPHKVFRLLCASFSGSYEAQTLKKWLINFYRRFFNAQFKRSCLPDGPKAGSVALSPRGDWRMPSDAVYALWLKEAEEL